MDVQHAKPVEFWNRVTQKVEQDPVYAGWFIRWCYRKPLGRLALDLVFSRVAFNRAYGWYKRSRWSAPQIQKDLAQFAVDLTEFENSSYQSYADFFLRKFKTEARPFETEPSQLCAWGEGKYLAYANNTDKIAFPVKGQFLKARDLLGNHAFYEKLENGPIVICRLCPLDYHWYHFPVAGNTVESYRVPGIYHSVNILALQAQSDVFIKNERQITIFESDLHGYLALIEVGALCVGKIYQEDDWGKGRRVERGQLKGHFDFGASTIIMLGQKGLWAPSKDLLEQTAAGRESFVRLGTSIGGSPTR